MWSGFAPIPIAGCSILVNTSDLSNPAPATADAASPSENDSGAEGGKVIDPDGGDGGGGTKFLLRAGGYTTCAARGSSLWCWGNNASGQIGDGTTTKRDAPVAVLATPAGEVTSLGVGETHSCAVIAGDAYCWGSGGAGQLGDGRKDDSTVPVKVTGLPAGKVTQVSASTNFSCAVANNAAYCWGTNGTGQLGNPVGAASGIPVPVANGSGGLNNVTEISNGQDHACARVASGDVYCWGHNDNGTLGTSKVNVDGVADSAMKVEGLPGPAQKLAFAAWHACVIISGATWCWGTGTNGELGNGGTSHSTQPVAAIGLATAVTTLALGGGPNDGDSSCAVRAGEALCWGQNQYGRLGDGQTAARGVANPVATLPKTVVDVAAAFNHACALLANDEVRCWGRGTNGQLGDGAGVDRSIPVTVTLPP
jgi:alpha-tubulin suppressor-like RCC1 family protein